MKKVLIIVAILLAKFGFTCISELSELSTALPQTKEECLLMAAQKGDLDSVSQLLIDGANIECRGEHDFTPLHWAAKEGHLSIVTLLLKQGASFKALNKSNNTALHAAAYRNHPLVI